MKGVLVMSSKEKLVSVLKELEEEIAALEEKMISKTEKKYEETLSEFHLFIKNRSRELEARMDVVDTKIDQHLKYGRQLEKEEVNRHHGGIKVATVPDF